MKFTSVLKGAYILFFIVLMTSCSATRHQDLFSYKPAYAGPEMGSDQSTDPKPLEILPTPSIVVTEKQSAAGKADNALSMIPADHGTEQKVQPQVNGEIGILMEIAENTARERLAGEQTSIRSTIRKMAGQYAVKTNTTYSEKQLKKMDKIALKLEKKQQQKAPDVQWGPANNLEWAILGAAAVGLFVGIFGIGFGWFIFLIAALAYLYFKLLHNN